VARQRLRATLSQGVKSARLRVQQLQRQVRVCALAVCVCAPCIHQQILTAHRLPHRLQPPPTHAQPTPTPTSTNTHQLDDTQPGPSYLASLAESIDSAELTIAAVKRDQIDSYSRLVDAQQKLERQLGELEESVEGDAAAAAEGGGEGCAAFITSVTASNQSKMRGQKLASTSAAAATTVTKANSKQPLAAAGGSATTPTATGSSSQRKSPNAAASGLLPEVVEYSAYLARTGGPTGGWHEEDHAVWIAALQRSKGDAAQAALVAEQLLPGMTRAQVGGGAGLVGLVA